MQSKKEGRWPYSMPLFQLVVCGEELSGKTFAVNYLKEKFEEQGFRVFTVGECQHGQFLSNEDVSYDDFAALPPLERRDYSLRILEERIEAERHTAERALNHSTAGFKSVMIVDRPWWDGYYYMLKRAKEDKGKNVEYRWEDVLADLLLRGRMVFCGYGVFPMFVHLSPLSYRLARSADFSENRPSKAFGDGADTIRYRIQSFVDYQLFFLYIKSIIIYHKAVMTATVDSEISTLKFPTSYRDKVLRVIEEHQNEKSFDKMPTKKRLACLEVLKTFNSMSIHAMLEGIEGKKRVSARVKDEIAESKKMDWLLFDFGTILSVMKQLLDVIDLGWFSPKEKKVMLEHFANSMFVHDFDSRRRFLDDSIKRVMESYEKTMAVIEKDMEEKKQAEDLQATLGKASQKNPLDIN